MTNSSTISVNGKRTRWIALVLALAAAAVMVVPASGMAATKFGAKLNGTIQPSNSLPAQKCVFGQPAAPCTRVSMDAYNNAGHERAPRDGVIRKVKLIAGGPGSFRLQLAKARPNKDKAKIVEQGPRLRYDGQVGGDPYEVESFHVHVPVEKGEYLATKSRKTSMLRCSSGGPNQFLFQPALSVGGPFQTLDYTDGCWLLLEAVYK
jgi:hypothetical protein